MKAGLRYITIFCLLALFPLIPQLTDAADMDDYTLTPPFVSQIVPPNILLVLDESGSMQCSSYLYYSYSYIGNGIAGCGTSTSDTYNYDIDYSDTLTYREYYGYFDPDKYYEYDSGSSKFIEAGCTFSEGDTGYMIGDQTGNCISGNFLNWASMSRVDLMRKALMGGKSVADLGNGGHTLQGEGGRWTFTDSNSGCMIEVSGGTGFVGSDLLLDHVLTISNSGDDWGTCGYLTVRASGNTIWGSSDSFRYIYQPVSGDFDVSLRIISTPTNSAYSKGGLMVRASTDSSSARVMVTKTNTHGIQSAERRVFNGSTYRLASDTEVDTIPVWVRLIRVGNEFKTYYSYDVSYSGSLAGWTLHGTTTATILPDDVLIGMATASYSWSTLATAEYDEFVCETGSCSDDDFNDAVFNTGIWTALDINTGREGSQKEDCSGGCVVGTITNARIRVDTDDRTGVIQGVSDMDNDGLYDEDAPRFGVEIFSSGSGFSDRSGCMRVGLRGTTLASVVSSIEDEDPLGSTPQDPAIAEAWDYFAQSNAHSNCGNSSFISRASSIDPFYMDDPVNVGSQMSVPCKPGYVLLISDGEWNTGGDPLDKARDSHVSDIRTDLSGIQLLDHYAFFIFGSAGSGRNAMQQIAMFGGFDDNDEDTWPYDRTSYPADSRNVVLPAAPCEVDSTDAGCKEWDDDGDGIPDNYFEATSGKVLEEKLIQAISEILAKASSGTASSVLASGEGKGANILQAVFYPKRRIGGIEIAWIGALSNLWYYIDPYFLTSSIREDSVRDSVLNTIEDYIVQFHFDTVNQRTKANLIKDEFGDNSVLTPVDDIVFEDLKSIWDAGTLLWGRDISDIAKPRTIMTTTDGSNLIDFSTFNKSSLRPYLQAVDDAEAEAVIRYIHGEDTDIGGGFTPPITGFTGKYRQRTVAIDLNNDGDTDDTVFGLTESAKVWKLGDIVNSTPKVVSWVPLNLYDDSYNDRTYKAYTEQYAYERRGISFVGGNDGMLHAFRLGILQLKEDPAWNAGANQHARLINPETDAVCDPSDLSRCGDEIWAFIPENALPYLKYFADPNYGHIYTVDATPHLVDASIGADANLEKDVDGDSWRTVLIGSMRLGGGSGAAGSGCSNCVEAPGADLDNDGDLLETGENLKGSSSYFAIDVTDPSPYNWTLLWEFSNEDIPSAELSTGGLGLSTAGSAIVRINPLTCKNAGGVTITTKKLCNGEWFAVIPSGPTGPIDTSVNQFMGRSNQNLKLFVLDLRDGTLKATINTNITNAFGGSAIQSTVDSDGDYQDDALYIGYTNSTTGGDTNTWTDGGVLRIMTYENPDPVMWEVHKVMDETGPVTTAVDRLQNTRTGKLWLYFGDGRYYYKLPNVVDDESSQRRIYGIKDPCFENGAFITTCTSADKVAFSSLLDVTTDLTPDEDDEGWYNDLDPTNFPLSNYAAERVITDPDARTCGLAFFTTFKPTVDVCGFGGLTYMWAVKYNTGGAPSADDDCRARVLLQVGTGEIKDISLPGDLNGKKTAGVDGPPSREKPSSFVSPVGITKNVHVIER